jgi:GNAT superfamily N-acetyltransferase
MNIRPATPADAENVGPALYHAFCGVADRHRFPHDFPSAEGAMQLARMCVGSPDILGFVAEAEDGRFLGSNFLWRQDAICGVGPISVVPDAQGRGVGRALMGAVIEAGKDAAGIRLVQDAFNTASLSLYAGLGFEVKEPLVLMQGSPTGAAASPDTRVRPLEGRDHAACGELCRRVHGFDRSVELGQVAQVFPSVVAERDGRVVAYMAAPPLWNLNHAVADTDADM